MSSLHGWIIYNGHLGGKKFLDFAEWVQEAAAKLDITTSIIKNNALLPILQTDSSNILHKENRLPDFVVYGDKDIPLARQLETLGIPVFNSSEAIAVCDNKILMYQELARKQLPIPKTIIAPKIFPNTQETQLASFLPAAADLGYPLIIKEAFGSFGEQVYLIQNEQELLLKIKQLGASPFVLQEFISSSAGKDIRINVVGGKAVAAMIRTSKTDFRANVSAGGKMEPYTPSENQIQIALQAAQAVGTDFAGVDLLFGENGKPIVCEVNSNAHIRSIYDCTGINVTDHIMAYIAERLVKSS